MRQNGGEVSLWKELGNSEETATDLVEYGKDKMIELGIKQEQDFTSGRDS